MSSFRRFVQAEIARRCAKNPRYSLRACARALELDPATLSQLVRGKRPFTGRSIRRIGAALGLDDAAIEAHVRDELRPRRQPPGPLRSLDELEADLSALVHEWQHHAILELTTLEEFLPDSRWIARVLDTTPDRVNVALQRLTRLGLLTMVSSARWTTAAAAPAPAPRTPKGPTMGRPVVQWQMIAKDPERLATFYSRLFGWTIDADNALGYRQVRTGSEKGIQGGIWPAPPEAPAFVQLFVEVEDLGGSVAEATALGAEVIVPPQALPDGDALTILRDPAGIPFGMYCASPR